MSRFVHWSGIVHDTLSPIHPSLKLGQSREILAAALGHNSYASFRLHDLPALELADCAVLDPNTLLRRAHGLGIALTAEEWQSVEQQLTRFRICNGCYVGDERILLSAGRSVFENKRCHAIGELARTVGMIDGVEALEAALMHGELPPGAAGVLVRGEILAFNENEALAIPVIAEVQFERIGRHLYRNGNVVNLSQRGLPHPYEQEEIFEMYGP